MKTLLAMSLAIATLAAQDRGTIRGSVTDQTGAAIPAASVTAHNIDNGLKQSTVSGADGTFNIPYLPAGN